MKIYSIIFIALLAFTIGCDKQTDYSLNGSLPSSPDFSVVPVEGDPNSFVVTDLSSGNFNRVWVFANGIPATSKLQSDTVFYSKKGSYEIKLHVSATDGNGTAFSSKRVEVENDVAGCLYKFMTEECTEKCWSLSGAAGGVKVGPIPYSGEWYTSPDIVPTQADDKWCFGEDGVFKYDNNGSSFSACQGFIEVVDYPIPSELTWTYEEAAGFDALNRIDIQGIWMGIEDSGPTYDIISVSENEMMLLAPIKPCDGAPSNGWFTLTFNKVL